MKALGYKRIDKQGRFIIPREYLKQYKVKSGDNFKVWIGQNDTIVIQKEQIDRCVFCNKDVDLLETKIAGKSICQTCFDLFKVSINK